MWCFGGGEYYKIIWFYQLSWQCELATVKRFVLNLCTADVASWTDIPGGPGTARRDDAIFSVGSLLQARKSTSCRRRQSRPGRPLRWLTIKKNSGQSAGRIRILLWTGSVRISVKGFFRPWSKFSPENMTSSRLANPGSPRMRSRLKPWLASLRCVLTGKT